MAARLIRLTTRMLAVPLSFQPTAIPSECTRLVQAAPPFSPCLAAAALHTSSPRHLADNLPEVSETFNPTSPSNDFFYFLQTQTSIHDLLNLSTHKDLHAVNEVLILQRISQLNLGDQKIMRNKTFKNLLDKINNQVTSLPSNILVKLLKCMYALQIPNADSYMESVKVEVEWRLRKFNIGTLAHLAIIISPRSLDDKLVRGLVKQVELRWMEISDYRTLIRFLSKLGFLSSTLMERLEDKVLEFADRLTPDVSRTIITLLAKQKRRSMPVLRALSYHLAEYKSDFPLSICIDLAFAYARLNFYQTPVLQKICTDMMPKLGEINPLGIAHLTRSLSTLRFCDQVFYEAIAQTILDRHKEIEPIHIASILVSFGLINYQPHQSEEFFNMIHERLIPAFDSLPWFLILNSTWALCTLNQVTAPYLEKVLTPEFYNQTVEGSPAKAMGSLLKLMHINTTAQLECSWYRGPLLTDDMLLFMQDKFKEAACSALQHDVQETLVKIFPGTLNSNVCTIYGWVLDGEVILDSSLQALPIKDYVAPHNPASGGTQPLPDGARRVAFVCREFMHFLFPGKELMGRHVMSRSHLQAAGFVVVEVCYYDWQDLKSDLEKQNFLKNQMRKALAF